MNPLATELNNILQGSTVSHLLSKMGKEFYFPKGIVSQSAEASQHAREFNATIGTANKGTKLIHLSTIKNMISGLGEEEIFPYAPNPGVAEFRKVWQEHMLKKNPALQGKRITRPLVTTGITNGISILADMFIDPGDKVILPDMFWGNYRLIIESRRGGQVVNFPFFNGNGFNLDGFRDLLAAQSTEQKIIVLLNFPNNPTGYTPTEAEAKAIVEVLKNQAEQGSRILVVFDDSYFSLFYEEETCKQSLFAFCADLHPNLLAVKLDGATKEDFVWGFRLGFITLSAQGMTDEQYDALDRKLKGMIRSTVSNCNHLGQSLLLHAMQSPEYAEDKAAAFQLLNAKYQAVKQALAVLHSTKIEPLPFNSGYFMCFKLKGVNAEKLRQYLLYEKGIGTIAIQEEYLRIAYSCVDTDRMAELYQAIYTAVDKLA